MSSSLSHMKRSRAVFGVNVQSTMMRNSHRKGKLMKIAFTYRASNEDESVSGCSSTMSGKPSLSCLAESHRYQQQSR